MRTVRGVLATTLISALLALPAVPAAAGLPPSEWVVGPREKVAFLTFEGVAKRVALDNVLSDLERKQARASFFMHGAWVRRHQARVRRMSRAGHDFGNRGWNRTLFTRLGNDALRSSILRGEDALADLGIGSRPFLRAPQGVRDLRVLQVAGSLGYRSVRWTYKGGWGKARSVARRVVRNVQPGAIVGLELWKPSNRRALPRIIDGLRRKGYNLRTLGRLESAHPIRWDVTLRSGSTGAEVTYLQKALRAKTYPAGAPDGTFGYKTLQATYAFEKVHKLRRDGVVTPKQMTAIATSHRPRVTTRGRDDMLNVDISRQVVFEVRNGKVLNTLPMSSGNEEYYTVDGETYKAHTPRGEFTIQRKIRGERHGRLGVLYNPLYFIGGYAFHGSKSVPTHPASHGCVRLPMYVSLPFFDRNPVGRYVYVHD